MFHTSLLRTIRELVLAVLVGLMLGACLFSYYITGKSQKRAALVKAQTSAALSMMRDMDSLFKEFNAAFGEYVAGQVQGVAHSAAALNNILEKAARLEERLAAEEKKTLRKYSRIVGNIKASIALLQEKASPAPRLLRKIYGAVEKNSARARYNLAELNSLMSDKISALDSTTERLNRRAGRLIKTLWGSLLGLGFLMFGLIGKKPRIAATAKINTRERLLFNLGGYMGYLVRVFFRR